ncbi:MAG TPA: AI-2E family transporter [Burkholderiales bacterium]|nr:AI-2E family transporter [Burkholderiales bacterium]
MASSPLRRAPSRIDQILTLLVLGILIGGCFLVLRPFLTALLWAVVLCVTTWPLYEQLRYLFMQRHTLAAAIMSLLIAVVFLAPFVIVGMTLADNSVRMAQWTREFMEQGPPDPPAWVAGLPLIGERAAAYWSGFAHDTAQFTTELGKLIDPAKAWLLAGGASIAQGLLQLTLSILIAFFFFRDGDAAVLRVRAVLARLAPRRGARLLELAAATMRGVVYGILGTAVAQGVLMAIGLWIAGIGAAPLLGLVTFFLSPVPIGPPLVWIPAGLWLIYKGSLGWGIFMFLWGMLVVSTVDNVLKPLIISRGSNLPFVLVLLGVLGGVVAFGFIGVFLGPVLLALGVALLSEWAVIASEESVMVVGKSTPRAGTEHDEPI